MRLTDIAVRALQAPNTGQKTYSDEALPGFGVRVSQGGTKTFVVVCGPTRERITIGRFPIITLSEARTEAKRLLAEKTLGKNRPKTVSYNEARKEFLGEVKSKNRVRTHRDYSRLMRHFAFGNTKLGDIAKQDIKKRLAKLDRVPSERRHALVAIKVFFNWVVREEYLAHSPCEGLQVPSSAKKRKHALSHEELGKVLARSLTTSYPYGPIVALCLLTGQRRGEIAALEWEWIDRTNRTITLPGSITKNHKEHVFPYGDLAAAVLESIPIVGNARYVFPASRDHVRGKPTTTFNGWGKAKLIFDEGLDGVRPYTLHDLRRSLSTHMAPLKVPQLVVEKLLNHVSKQSQSDIAQVYNVYEYLPEMRDAVTKYETHLVNLLKT
ncbi:tyrosine-type recombinase/integrase [Mesorhizobium sp. B1-1-8]|uniref:tyrosine-type recombinase/integrase n=1 Tax=Mesorhizobium sp. B1-1-8 TaxID=2589976 RepID=UPI0011286DF6|nr:tyrosine-type recombinase/integrase [Mesorhizobium sp. B1-1-8]UCI07384.1 tyrosine-type recombinase/integrase [Mesorhizobium sp. B1-1-8]